MSSYILLKKVDRELKLTAPENDIGTIFFSEGISNIDVSVKTSIPTYELSRIRNGEIRAISAYKVYLISLAIDIPLTIFLDRAYRHLKLLNENISTESNATSSLTSLGAILKTYEDNALQSIAFKTGITLKRLKDLSQKKATVVLAHELFLIEMALGKNKGDLFNELFNDIQLNSLERQNQLRLEEVQKKHK